MTDAGNHLGNDLEVTKCRANKLNCHFEHGGIAWVKIQDSSWWLAQVVDEKNVWCKPKKKAKDDVLVRLYGTYDYLYVDPIRSASGLKDILKQWNGNLREAFQTVLEEDISRMKSAGSTKRKRQKVSKSKDSKGNQKEKSDEAMEKSLQKKKRKQDAISDDRNTKKMKQAEALKDKNDEVKEARGGQKEVKDEMKIKAFKNAKPKQNGPSNTKAAEKAKHNKAESPVSTKCETPEATPNISARRVRVMQNLGLIAPLGSPFSKC